MPTPYAPAALLSAIAEQQLAETRLVETPFLGMLARTARIQDQRAIQWGARIGDAQGSGRAVGGALSEDSKGAYAAAELMIPNFYFKYHMNVDKRALIEAAAIGKVQALRDAAGNEIDDGLRSIAQDIENALFIGEGTENSTEYGVYGLKHIVKQAGAYAGITRNARWKSLRQQGGVPGTPENLTADRITALKRERRKVGATYMRNDGTRLIALTSDEIEKDVIRKLYQDEAAVQAVYGNVVAEVLPYVGYAMDGVPVVSSINDETANKVYWVDPSKLQLYVFNDNHPAAMNDDKISFFNYQGLQMRMAMVNDDHPDKYELEMSVSLQLKCHDLVQGVSVMEDVAHTYTAA